MADQIYQEMISAEEQARFQRDGYCVVRGLYTLEEVKPVRDRLEEFYEGKHTYGWPNEHLRSFDSDDRDTAGGNYRSGSLQRPASIEETFHTFAYNPKLIVVMEQLLGGAVKLYTDQTIFKPGAIKAGRSFYHQDGYYWRLKPGACINAWVALDEVDRGTIAMGFMEGSQRDWRIARHEEYWDEVRPSGGKEGQQYKRKRIPLDAVDESKDLLIPGSPGDAFFFSNYTWHRAEPNLSGMNRAAYAIAYQLDREDNKLSDEEFNALLDS